MAVAKFLPHLRNEFAIHRWDFAGDDEMSSRLLAQPELTGHAVGILGEILLCRGRQHDPAPDEDFHVWLRSGDSDLRVVVQAGQAYLQQADEQADEPTSNWIPLRAPCSSGAADPVDAAASAATSASPLSPACRHYSRATDALRRQ
jgi:hypothetical protein